MSQAHDKLVDVRARLPIAALTAVLAIAGLTACQSNVGTAATYNGSRISESQVDSYITPSAKPVSDGTASLPPRSVVLLFLIENKVVSQLQATPPLTPLSQATIDTSESKLLAANKGRAYLIKSIGLTGFTGAFQDYFFRTLTVESLLHQEVGDTQGTASLGQIATALKLKPAAFKVQVNARYGTWDASALSLTSSGQVPSYLTLPSTTAQAGATG